MSKYSHVFLDFDETMFNHLAMAAWVDRFFVKKYGTKPGDYTGTFDSRHEPLGEKMRLYHHEAHVREVTNKQWREVKQALENEIRHHDLDFCYPETHRTLVWLLKQSFELGILTFGNEEYQLYKINSCAYLRGLDIPVYVVGEHKREYLEREFKTVERGVLVDDKHPLNLHAPWESIWIDRRSTPQEKPEKISSRVHKIYDLMQLKELLV